MEEADDSQIRRERIVSAPVTPRERRPASPKRTPEPREGDTYDALLDYDSDTYDVLLDYDSDTNEDRRKRRYKPVKFVYAGKSTEEQSDEEVQRDWELTMAERRRWASMEGPLRANIRPRFAGVGSVKEREPCYREGTSSANDEVPSELLLSAESLQLV